MLCTIGDLIEDVVVWLNSELQNQLNIGSDSDSIIVRTRGGSAANVAMFGALTGTRSRFIGQVGNDNLGVQLCASLRGSGVDVCTVAQGRTGSIVVVVQPNGERTFLTDRGVASDLSVFDASHLAGVSIVHVPTYSLAQDPLATTAVQYIRAARAAGALISVDASSTSVLRDYSIDRYAALVASIAPDVFLCNNNDASGATLGNCAHIDTRLAQRCAQLLAKIVVANLTDKSRWCAVQCAKHRNVGCASTAGAHNYRVTIATNIQLVF